jgi:hypothetical protein
MVKENTHLYLASIIRNQLPKKQQDVIDKNLNLYYVGSIAPDILFYNKGTFNLGNLQHNNPKKIIKDLIKLKAPSAFIYGYITHVETDKEFHKVLPKLNKDHLYMETSIDKEFIPKKTIGEWITPEIPDQFAQALKINKSSILKILKYQIRVNHLFLNSKFLKFFAKAKDKPLFYASITKPRYPKETPELFKKSIQNAIKEIKKLK